MTARPAWERRIVGQVLRPPETARRNRLLDTTRKIINVGLDLAAASPDGNFTVQDLVAQAGISLHSFYRSFASKDELSLAVFEEAMRLGTQTIAERASRKTTPLERLRTMTVVAISPDFEHPRGLTASFIVSEDLRLRRIYPQEVHAALTPYRTLLAEAIASAQGAGEFSGIDATEDAELIHMVMMSRYQLLAEGVKPVRSRPPEEVVWEFCLGALRRHSHGHPSPEPGRTTTTASRLNRRPVRRVAADGTDGPDS